MIFSWRVRLTCAAFTTRLSRLLENAPEPAWALFPPSNNLFGTIEARVYGGCSWPQR